MFIKQRQAQFVVIALLIALFTAVFVVRQSAAQDDGAAVLREAWSNTERAGSYEFTTEMIDTRVPAARITAVGRSPEVKTMYVEGVADRKAQQLTLALWDDLGAIRDRTASYDVQIDGLDAQGRVHGGRWETIEDFSGSFAPAGDAAVFLGAAKNVRDLGDASAENPRTGNTTSYSRYAFTLDSDLYAEQMRGQLQAQLEEQGSLPNGVNISASEQYRNMFAEGEAWIDSDGLPLRMTIKMQFPQDRNGERSTVQIKTDFVAYNDQAAVGRIRLGTTLNSWLAQTATGAGAAFTAAVPAIGMATAFLGLFALAAMVYRVRPKFAHTTFATLLSAQMAFAPLASFADTHQFNQFRDRFPTLQSSEPDKTEQALAQIATLDPDNSQLWNQSLAASSAQQDRVNSVLNQNRAVTADTDLDGDNLSDAAERSHCINPDQFWNTGDNIGDPACSAYILPDSDFDGLTDGEEYLILGTYPNLADSDGDGLPDTVEIKGFLSQGVRAYSNPLSADTDGDGRIDGAECANLIDIDGESWTPALACDNTDPSTPADILNIDDDGDGVLSKIDLSPLTQLVPSGGHFDRDQPLALNLSNIAQGEPVLVDLQLRPMHSEQLSFALNYLDWPSGDSGGQVQRHTDSSFGSITPGTALDDPSYNGDMRVTPMLEVSLPSDTLELPRTVAEIDIPITDAGRVIAEVGLTAVADQTLLTVTSLVSGSYDLSIDQGSCTGGSGNVYQSAVTAGFSHLFTANKLGDFANGKHIIQISDGTTDYCLPIPSLVEGTVTLPLTIQSTGNGIKTLGNVYMETSSSSDSSITFSDLTGSYDTKIIAGTCQAQNSILATFNNVSSGGGGLLTGKNVSQIGDGEHAVMLSQGGELIGCALLPNIINGSLTGNNTVTPAIDLDALKTYQISVHEGENDKLIALVPLTLATDADTGERNAFNGRMFFQHGTNNTIAATVNLIWVVTALTDSCPDGNCALGTINRSQIIQTYRQEEWKLTGLRVEEELDYDVAVIYEDPTTDQITEGMTGEALANRNLEVDDNLWALVRGLQATFLPGRDINGNDVRDYSVSVMESYFDTAAWGNDTRFGIRDDALNVETYQFEQQAEIGDLLNTHIPTILSNAFGDGEFDIPDLANNPTTTVRPTLLFASESRSRSIDLDEQLLATAAPLVTVSNNVLTLNLDPTKVEPTTFASLSWKPFQYANGEWEPAPIDEYVTRLKGNLKGSSEFLASTEEEEFEVAGNLVLVEMAYLTYYLGRANAVAYTGDLAWEYDTADGLTDAELSTAMNGVKNRAASSSGMIKAYIVDARKQIEFDSDLFARMKAGGTPPQVFDSLKAKEGLAGSIGRSTLGQTKALSNGFFRKFSNIRKSISTAKVSGAGGMAFAGSTMLAGVAGSFFSATSDNPAERGVSITLKTLNVAGQLDGIRRLNNAFRAFQVDPGHLNTKFSAFVKSNNATRASKIAGVVGLVVSIGFVVGAFIATVVGSELGFLSLAFNQLLAFSAASIILIVLLAALATTGVGLIIVTIISLIDALIFLFCGIAPPADDNVIAQWVCKGISGLLTEAISFLIYDQTDIISVNDPNRLSPSMNMFLSDPALGFTANSLVTVDMAISNTVSLESADSLLSGLYAWQFKDSNAIKATFAYSVTATAVTDEEQQLHSTRKLELGQNSAEWQESPDDVYTIGRIFSGAVPLPAAGGINQPLSAFMVEGAATPIQECVMIPNPTPPFIPPAVPVCWIRSRDKSTYNDLKLKFDVFPETLNGFYTLVDKDGGKALAWGQTGDVVFPRLLDADGDGLVYSADPDDGDYDNDNDGLSDLRETQIGSNPSDDDSDNDLLRDGDELRNGTDPTQADSDNDGIPDGDEINGWTLTYNQAGDTTRAWPNPLVADADGDGVIDRIEKALGTNPNVTSSEDALGYEATLIENDAPLLLLKLDEGEYTTAFPDSAGRRAELSAVCSAERCPVSGLQGQRGNGALFNGSTDLLVLGRKIPEVNTLTNNFTVAAWIYPNNTSSTQRIIGTSRRTGNDGYSFGLVGDELRLTFYARRDFDTSGVDIQPGQWTHVAATLTAAGGGGTDARFYVNGVQAGATLHSNNGNGAAVDDSDDLMVGAIYTNNVYDPDEKPEDAPYVPAEFFDGMLDEIIIYDRVLDTTELGLVRDGRYDVNDAVVQPNAELTFNTHMENQFFGRTVEGLLQTELPSIVSGTTVDHNFQLTRNDGTANNALDESIALTVNGGATSGTYDLIQTVGAHIDEPTAPLPNQDANQVFRAESVTNYNGTTSHSAYRSSDYQLNSSDFTLATWVNPDTVSGVRSIMGWDSTEDNGYPSLMIVDGKIRMGFGTSAGWKEDTTNSVHVTAGQWTHIAISYDRGTNVGTLFINGVKPTPGDNLAFTHDPNSTGDYFEIGRSTNLFTVDFGDTEVKCEEDSGGPEYTLTYVDATGGGNIWHKEFVDDVEDTASRFVLDAAMPTQEFREQGTVQMCENDRDGSDNTTCDTNDRDMGKLLFNYYTVVGSVTNHTFSTTPSDPDCRWNHHYDDWIEMDYVHTLTSLPFDGSIKDTRIIKRTMTAAQITDLFQSTSTIAHYKMNDIPGSTVFDDELATAVGTCSDPSCPLTGVLGRENVAAHFDGVNDYISADEVSGLARTAANSGNQALTFGGWFKPDDDFDSIDPTQYLLSFHSSSGSNRLLLGIVAEGSNAFKVRFYDGLTGGDTISTQSYPRGTWHHIAVSIDYTSSSNNGKLFVNGVPWTTFSTTTKPTSTGKFSIGQDWDGGTASDFFKGSVDEVIVLKEYWPSSSEGLAFFKNVPSYRQGMDHGDRYISISNFQQVNNCQPFCTKNLVIDGQASPGLNIGVTFDMPIPNETTEIEFRTNQFLVDLLIIDESVTEGAFSWQTPFNHNSFDYTIRSINSEDAPTQAWFADRPQAARGQLYNALDFTLNTLSSVNSFEVGREFPPVRSYGTEYTVAMWVNPRDLTGSGDVYRPIIGTFDNSTDGQFFLGLKNGKPFVQVRTNSGQKELLAPNAVPSNVWTHIAVRYSDHITIFVNGSQVADLELFGASHEDLDPEPTIGKGWWFEVGTGQVGGVAQFSGLIDAISAYDKPLLDEEIAKLYNFQVTWQDEHSNSPITVDIDKPTHAVQERGNFVSQLPERVMIQAHDEHSAPVTADIQADIMVGGFGFDTVLQVSMSPCTDTSNGNTVFCPLFAPPQEGQYHLDAVVFDSAGNSSFNSGGNVTQQFIVDGSAPTLLIDALPTVPIRPNAVPGAARTWELLLSGSANDPDIDYGNFADYGTGENGGSGLQSVSVQLFEQNGQPVGSPQEQIATITPSTALWTIAYRLEGDNPTGTYFARVTAVDVVGNPIVVDSPNFMLDTTDPTAQVTSYGVAGSRSRSGEALPFFLNKGTALVGTVDDQPISAETQTQVAGIDTVQIAIEQMLVNGAPTDLNPLPAAVQLFLPLDRSDAFENVTDTSFTDIVASRSASCSGNTCPLSGISSPNGQGVSFDGVDDALEVAYDGAVSGLTNNFTVAAWIKVDSGSGFGRIISTARTNSNSGYGFGQFGSKIVFTTYGVHDYFSVGDYFTPGVWQHIAVHLTSSNDAEFYINGVLVETVTSNSPGNSNPSDRLLIGATTEIGVSATSQHFAGSIDSATVSTGKLTGRDWDAIFGMQPTLHLKFDEQNVIYSNRLADASGLGAVTIYNRFSVNDATDHSKVGIVGAYGLQLTPDSDGFGTTAVAGQLPFGDESFTISLWIEDMNLGALVYGSNGNKVTFGTNSLTHTFNGTTYSVPVGAAAGWKHFTFVYDNVSDKLTTYVNGVAFAESSIPSGSGLTAVETELSFTHQSAGATYALDDLRVYQRALGSAEVHNLARSNWQDATIAAREIGSAATTWSGTVPADVEGFYNLFVRGSDTAGNVDEEPQPAWSGIIDTKEPLVIVTEIDIGGGNFLYDLFAQDFALDEGSLVLPATCGNVTTQLRQTNDSPWVLAIGDQVGAPFELVAAVEITCETSSQLPATAVLGICDRAGNCVYQHPDGSVVPTAVGLDGISAVATSTQTVAIITLLLLTLSSLTIIWTKKRRYP